jgi:crotonobetaine/carnitine-CoA ligase
MWKGLKDQELWSVCDLMKASRDLDRWIQVAEDRRSFGELWLSASKLAEFVSDSLRGDDDRTVAVVGENSVESVEIGLAAGLAGAPVAFLDARAPETYLQAQLAALNPKVLAASAKTASRLDMADDLQLVLLGDGLHGHGVPIAEVSKGSGDGMRDFDPVREPSYDTDWLIVHTGGTTGLPRGVVCSTHYLLMKVDHYWRVRQGRPDDVLYTPLPLFHNNAWILTILTALCKGVSAIVDDRFSVSEFWDRVAHCAATQVSLVGPQTMMLLREGVDPKPDSHRVRVMMTIPDLGRSEAEERFGVRVVGAGYGTSEAAPITDSSGPRGPEGSSGRAGDFYEILLMDEMDQPVTPGDIGEVCVRPNKPFGIFSGYWGDPASTLAKWRNGWFHTGDRGRFDIDGWFWFEDRVKDYIRHRGENIPSGIVEEAVMNIPGVAAAAAIGVPSPFGEEDVLVALVPAEGRQIEPMAVIDQVAASLPFYAVPRYVRLVPELPRSELGRVLKRVLRDTGITDETFDLEAHGLRVSRRGIESIGSRGT